MNTQTNRSIYPAELRAGGDGRTIVGKIPYDSEADLGGFREVLEPGCFAESLRGRKIVALWSHDSSKPLANTGNGSLSLRDDADGLSVEIQVDPQQSWGRDALLAVKRGDLNGLSFGFSVAKGGEQWSAGGLRRIFKAALHEISPVVWPAYEESTINVRSNTYNRGNTMNKRYQYGEKLMTEAEFEARRSINQPPEMDFNSIEVEDQPVYRGPYPLGQLMMDISKLERPGNIDPDVRSRYEAMVNRERAMAEKRAAGTGGMVQAVGQDGGLLLQGETSLDLLRNGYNNSAILSRAAQRDLGTSQYVELVGVDEVSRADGSRGGGVRVYSDKELALIQQSKTVFDKIRLEPKRLTGMYFASQELLDNAQILESEMAALFAEEFSFKGQDWAINGSGAGEALGVMKAPALVTVAKEAAQAPATIVFENLLKMKARFHGRNRAGMLWVANKDVEAQLYTLSLPIGTGGTAMPVFVPSSDPTSEIAGTLLGIPIVFIEQAATLGTVGDILLCDWSMYISANRGGIQSASSMHLKFDYNQVCFRFISWLDGQPRVKAPMTPYKGGNTISAFVALATR